MFESLVISSFSFLFSLYCTSLSLLCTLSLLYSELWRCPSICLLSPSEMWTCSGWLQCSWNNRNSLTPRSTKGRVACHPGMSGGFKELSLLSQSELDWVCRAGESSARPTDPQRRGEEKHFAPVSAWVYYHCRETEIKQQIKRNRQRD